MKIRNMCMQKRGLGDWEFRIELHTGRVMRHYWSKILNALALKLAPWALLKVYLFTITNVQPAIP
jgi:hypothetical protein